MNGVFIDVQVAAEHARDRSLAARLAEICPVDIFAADQDGLRIIAENLDECVLCQLCLQAAPPGAVRIAKLYDGGALLGA